MSQTPLAAAAPSHADDAATAPAVAAVPPQTAGADAVYAAIDLGSNSFRLELGHFVEARYRRLRYCKETVRLGAGLDAAGHLRDDAVRAALDCLARFRVALEGQPPTRVRAVATQTVREARNRERFLARASQALGLPVELISGHEEARLIYGGVWCLQPTAQDRVVIDIGGRSTEIVHGVGARPVQAGSFPIGCVSSSLRHFSQGVMTAAAFEAARCAAEARFEEALEAIGPVEGMECLGASGTAGALSDLLQASAITDGTITLEALDWLEARCVAAGQVQQLQLPGLKDDRRPVLGGGLAVMQALMKAFGLDAVGHAKGALRQGVIADLQARHHGHDGVEGLDVQDAAVAALQARLRIDADQATRVRRTALALYDQLPAACRTDDARRELGWVCALHEAGLLLSADGHWLHGAYLVAHADLDGFSLDEQQRLAAMIAAQRGDVPDTLRHAGEPLAWALRCLRLAVIAAHARRALQLPELQLAASSDGRPWRLRVQCPRGTRHRSLQQLLLDEAERWAPQAGAATVLQIEVQADAS